MISHTTEKFRKAFAKLPKEVQRQARASYKLFIENLYHPSLHFKRVHPVQSIYSVRVSLDYRALGIMDKGEIVWYWIGPHSQYEKLISGL